MKKAQLSGFMIVIVLIILVVFLLVSFFVFTGFSQSEIDSEIQPYIQSCIEHSTLCGVVAHGLDEHKSIIDASLPETKQCTSILEQFKKQGYQFENEKPSIAITHTRDNVRFSVNYPIQVKHLGKSETYTHFEHVIPIPLQRLEEQKKEILEENEINENMLMQRNSRVLIEEIDKRTIQNILIDNSSTEYWYVINQTVTP